MSIKQLLSILLASIIMLLGVAQTAQAGKTGYSQQKVVYHINYDDAKKQSSTLRNIQNHINAVGPDNLDIRVVMHGNGLSLVLNESALKNVPKFNKANASTTMKQKIDSLKMQGVTFNVCANTVKGRKVNINRDLYDVDQKDIVASGVAELAHLQQQGFVYLRP
ncbi:MAG: DsrE family protein [Hydrogenovibrio crunogenus]|uniref:CDF cation efflux transporter protein n=1 Tax=Hydrogenovibrio crunogenus (strain DSM 25203 / XCL-2) TaxID=317025 RepID=Q31DM7_HYDCU|nr:DsrE family protein [Hydrogenovibrio crunogenus]